MEIYFFDDNPLFLEECKGIIEHTGYESFCHFYSSSDEIKKHIPFITKPCLFFLDLMVENSNVGFALSDYISQTLSESVVVFLTSYSELMSYNTHYKIRAKNWIMKNSTVLKDEILLTIDYVNQSINKTNIIYHLGHGEFYRIPVEEIVYVEVLKYENKLKINMLQGAFIVRDTLSSFENKVANYPFLYRCHNSNLVNVKYIKQINNQKRKITMNNNQISYFSRFRAKELLKRWKKY